ncbi:MAG: hypothetical protein K2P88_11820 [Chitinophagaceae bacterium]|uniref:hypothetical protein n=1 Tax=unclassified Paraflavitalea TaxID=2798305 RepID=UPI003D358AAC|nr:hypothetical protein [Chitinophagaceae bacterium]
MKHLLVLAASALIVFSSSAQFLYKDLLTVEAANQKHSIFKKEKVHSIEFISFDGEGKPIEGFSSNQMVNKASTEVATTTSTPLGAPTYSVGYYNSNAQLIKSFDTTDGSKTTVTYEYNAGGKLARILNITVSAGDFKIKEEHLWSYGTDGSPVKMLKVKNDKDTTVVTFIKDEKGNIIEERSTQKGKPLPTYYYYYDDAKRLTDVVRYNIAAKRLLPDYVMEYNEKGQLATFMVVQEDGDYQKWYYSYDEDGLKALDACYSKSKVLIGKVEYNYKYWE